jgi:protein-tyrosine-phosphatase
MRRLFSTTPVVRKRVLFQGPSIKPIYNQTLQKLNIGLAGHVVGGSLMILGSSFMGASPLPVAIFGGILWMQIMSTARMTELGSWVNLCKNITEIQRVEDEESGTELKSKERFILVSDGSKVSVEVESKSAASAESVDDEVPLPCLKELKQLGIIHVDDQALLDADPICRELFERDDLVVTMNETSKTIFPAPPGAANAVIPKLVQIYQKRQKTIHGENKKLAAIVANAPAVDPSKMIDRLGTASMALGGAVFVLGGGMFLASKSEAGKHQNSAQKPTS